MMSVTWTVVSLLLAFSTTCNSQVFCSGVRCLENADCEIIQGAYYCTCRAGYRRNSNQCEDINECAGNPCRPRRCENSEGSYRCLNQCATGYRRSSFNQLCVDINECAGNPCRLRRCENSEGSYRCLNQCVAGYRWSLNQLCVDINECAEGWCGLRLCKNSIGSYRCLNQCGTGYRWSSTNQACVDVNECDDVTPCSDNADCVNTIGSYRCTCKTGYGGNGIVCAETDSDSSSGSVIVTVSDPSSGNDVETVSDSSSGNGDETDSEPSSGNGVAAWIPIVAAVGGIAVVAVITAGFLWRRKKSSTGTEVVHDGNSTAPPGEALPAVSVNNDDTSPNRRSLAQAEIPHYEQIENTPPDQVYLNLQENSPTYESLTAADASSNTYSSLNATPTATDACPTRRNTYLTAIKPEAGDSHN